MIRPRAEFSAITENWRAEARRQPNGHLALHLFARSGRVIDGQPHERGVTAMEPAAARELQDILFGWLNDGA